MKPLTVAVFCFGGRRPIYQAWQVENMRRMMARHLTVPHRFVCVTDDADAMRAAGIEAVEIWPAPYVPPTRTHWLANYVRLGLCDPALGSLVGERILSIDLDAVVRANINDLVADPAPFKILSLRSRQQLQGGLFLIEPGALDPNPWALVTDPASDIIERSRAHVGSDQAVLTELFYPAVRDGIIPSWSEADGIAINDYAAPWRVFFRTGPTKCWDVSRPEYGDYMRESDREPAEIPEGLGPPPRMLRGPYQTLKPMRKRTRGN